MNNKLFMSALVGSHNYNLNTETSDKDCELLPLIELGASIK